jgi:hypothetical protein
MFPTQYNAPASDEVLLRIALLSLKTQLVKVGVQVLVLSPKIATAPPHCAILYRNIQFRKTGLQVPPLPSLLTAPPFDNVIPPPFE